VKFIEQPSKEIILGLKEAEKSTKLRKILKLVDCEDSS